MTDHQHAHSHAHHSRAHNARATDILLWPLLLIAGFAIVEAIGGWLTGSLALLGDAGHMASDAAALALAWLGAWLARMPPNPKHHYGFLRAEVLVALHLHRRQHTINHRAALLHVLGDLLGSVAALTAGVVIHFTGWFVVDPILSIFISLLILISTLRLLREAVHMLMEGAPAHLDTVAIRKQLNAVPGVEDVHHLRLWSLSSEGTALSAHVVLKEKDDWPQILDSMRRILREQYVIRHITLQPEFTGSGKPDQDACWLTDKPDTPST